MKRKSPSSNREQATNVGASLLSRRSGGTKADATPVGAGKRRPYKTQAFSPDVAPEQSAPPPDHPLTHEAISASAGSGKTYALAHRYIRLLAHDVPPDRIIALTFSRKAAGEIFDSVVEHLCKAARDDDGARDKARSIRLPAAGPALFRGLLRSFVDQLHRVHIGTIDSFIVGVARAFPAELGIPPAFAVMDTGGTEATEFRASVLETIFNPDTCDRDAQRRFLEAFKQATFGKEERGFGATLTNLIESYREKYQLLPDLACWGAEASLWSRREPWMEPVDDAAANAEELKREVRASGWDAKSVAKWDEFADAAAQFGPGSTWDALKYMYPRLAAIRNDLLHGTGELSMYRTTRALTAGESRAAYSLWRHVTGIAIRAALDRTRGIGRVLDAFESVYDRTMRRDGKLTFSDTQYLLTESNQWTHGALLSRQASTEGRIYIDYRLDCRLDHWLLDEFQDTSDLQWAAIRNLADEILQDTSGARTFFYVGDVKQSIYAWRGGNARLFGEILAQYGEGIREEHLKTCRRSAPPIVEAVNTVFGRIHDSGLPPGAVQRWAEEWKEHEVDPGKKSLPGCVALLEPLTPPDEKKPSRDDSYQLAADLLRRIDPLRRGLTAAVLVRTNKAGIAIADVLRRECPAMTVIHEGAAPLLDNPVVATLLSLVKFAAHPGDLFAWRHVQMSPLGRVEPICNARREELPLRLLRQIEAGGFAEFLHDWGGRLAAPAGTLDAFGQLRLRQLIDAAREFDATGNRACDEFLLAVEGRQVSDVAEKDAVRIMTVHKSKGLGFDVVILPELSESMDSTGQPGLLLGRDPETHLPAWALSMPRKDIAEADDSLAAELRKAEDEAGYDALCVLYVAMTRAKRGLYMIALPRGEHATTFDAAAFLKRQLIGESDASEQPATAGDALPCHTLHSCGDPDWYARLPAQPARDDRTAPPALPAQFADAPSRRRRLVQVEPSAEEEDVRRAAQLFEPENRAILDFGSAIHALFEKVTWAEEADAEQIIRDWLPSSSCAEDVKRDVCDQFRRALAADEVPRALARPAGPVELWKEQRFEVILNGNEWVTGAFDRVVIHRTADGRAVRADILDYKSNQVTAEADLRKTAKRYRSQLELYARALAHILHLPLTAIQTSILFTRSARVWRME